MSTLFIGLPAYNEKDSIDPLFTRIRTMASVLPMSVVVIVYDDGCTDGTKAQVLQWSSELEITYLEGGVNKGLGAGINALLSAFSKQGMKDDYLVIMDCDDTHDPAQIPQMLEGLHKCSKTDIIIASRYRCGATISGVPVHRLWLSVIAAMLYKMVHPIIHVRDYTCGYRIYRYSVITKLLTCFGGVPLKEKGFACMVELLLKLKKSGAIFSEIPLQLAYDNKRSASKMDVSGNAFRLSKKLLGWRLGGIK